MSLRSLNPTSRKALTIATCSSILVGAILSFGVATAIPSFTLYTVAHRLASMNNDTASRTEEFNAWIDEDKKFTQFEHELKSPNDFDPISREYESFKTATDSRFLHELYPVIPGWSVFLDVVKETDEVNTKSSIATERGMKRIQFKTTCAMVDDLNAGLDISKWEKIGIIDSQGTEGKIYKGKFEGLAIFNAENNETTLKGCGDTNLRYLDVLKAEQKRSEKANEEMDKQMQEELAKGEK